MSALKSTAQFYWKTGFLIRLKL